MHTRGTVARYEITTTTGTRYYVVNADELDQAIAKARRRERAANAEPFIPRDVG